MRPYKPWFRAATNTWYVEVAGRQQPLGRHAEAAPLPRRGKSGWNAPQEITTAFHRLMASTTGKLPDAESLQVAVVCDLFLDYSQKHHAPDTYRGYTDFLQDFCVATCSILAASSSQPP